MKYVVVVQQEIMRAREIEVEAENEDEAEDIATSIFLANENDYDDELKNDVYVTSVDEV